MGCDLHWQYGIVMQCNAMMIMGAGVSLYAHISLTNECA